jgi:bifunctional UDP-N-acetylglucosamine pyrophosphorylase/glucosamine-1-phosphate N-acetyltransferase
VIIVNGDHPLIQPESIARVVKDYFRLGCDMAVVSVEKGASTSFGRIVRDKDGKLLKIIDAVDATDEELRITECNSGIYLIKSKHFIELTEFLENKNAQKEYNITDLVKIMVGRGLDVRVVEGTEDLGMGVNSLEDLALANQMTTI